MPELRFQLHSHLPRCLPRLGRYDAGRLRTLPLHPVVLTSQLNSAEGKERTEAEQEAADWWRATGRI